MEKNNNILRDKVIKLQNELKELLGNNKHIYVHETNTFWEDSGELHIECEQGTIVWNLETLYNDLPHMLSYCIEEHKKKEQRIKKEMTRLIKNKI